MLSKWLASLLLLVAHVAVGLCDEEEYDLLLPVGGPKEIVPERVKQRHLKTALDFMLSLGGPVSGRLTQTFIQGMIPAIPTQEEVPYLAANVRGQIVPLGLYDNFERSVEYFYIMPRIIRFRTAIVGKVSWFNLLTSPDPASAIVADGVKLELSEAFVDGNTVFVRLHTPTGLIYGANRSFAGPIEGEPTFNFAAILYMDRDSKVCGYNIQAPHFGAFNRFIDPLRDGGFPSPEALALVPDSPFKRAYLPKEGVTTWLEEICDVATGELCLPVDGTKYYADKADCMEKLGQKRIGGYDDIDSDTLTCRALHRLLVPTRPEGHCKHLAPDLSEEEGGVCIDRLSEVYNKRTPTFQCGYDDVGYTNPIAPGGMAYVSGGYPDTVADFATTEPVTVPGPVCKASEAVRREAGSRRRTSRSRWGKASGPGTHVQ